MKAKYEGGLAECRIAVTDPNGALVTIQTKPGESVDIEDWAADQVSMLDGWTIESPKTKEEK